MRGNFFCPLVLNIKFMFSHNLMKTYCFCDQYIYMSKVNRSRYAYISHLLSFYICRLLSKINEPFFMAHLPNLLIKGSKHVSFVKTSTITCIHYKYKFIVSFKLCLGYICLINGKKFFFTFFTLFLCIFLFCSA